MVKKKRVSIEPSEDERLHQQEEQNTRARGEAEEEEEKGGGDGQQEDVAGEEVDEDDDEQDDEDEEEDCAWRFGKDVDLLALAEGDGGGGQPYQQFERLEYEALAERRRKALADRKPKSQDLFGASVDEILEASKGSMQELWEASGFGSLSGRRRRKKHRRRRLKTDPVVTKKLGEANLLYATSKYEEALTLLKDVVRLAPNMPEPYHTLGLVYNAMGNRKKATSFYMLAAHLTPKDISLWKRLASWSMEENSAGQAIYCLKRAMKADPDDVLVKWELASLFANLKDYAKAADTYETILKDHPADVEVCKMVAQMRHRSGCIEEAVGVLKKLIDEHPTEANLTVVNLLADLYMEKKDFASAITSIEQARRFYCSGQGLPVDLAVKAGICHAYLGNHTGAKVYFEALGKEQVEEFPELAMRAADVHMELDQHRTALQYYNMLDGITSFRNKTIWAKMAECHEAVNELAAALTLYEKVLKEFPEDVDVRLAYVSLLLKAEKVEEALSVVTYLHPEEPTSKEPGWLSDENVVVLRARILLLMGRLDTFLEVIVPLFQKALNVELHNQKIKGRRRVPKSVLVARVKELEELDAFIRCNPLVPPSQRVKAARARKALAKLEALKEEKRAAVLAAGLDWHSEEDSEPEVTQLERMTQPLPKLFEDEEYYQLLVQTCKVLSSKKRYGEALEMINKTLQVVHPNIIRKRVEIRSLGAEITFKARDAKNGYECVRYLVQQQPYSLSAWNWYYQAVSSSETKVPKHNKFILSMRSKYPDCIPPMVICGHQFSMISQPQGALREYLRAYKLQPEDPFLNLSVGVSLINLSLGFRLTNRNQCVLQGFAFLHKYQQLSEGSQESLYNLARAYHHVGLVTIAVQYYEKVLSHFEKDYPVSQLSDDLLVVLGDFMENIESSSGKLVKGYCDLRKEAAYNLHLIYKKSGADDLARQVLQDYCTP